MRDAPRASINVPFTLDAAGITCTGRTTDLSLTGAFLDLPVAPQLSSLVNFKFRISSQSPPFEVLARVVRRTALGIAVEFLDLDNHARALLWDGLIPYLPKTFKDCPYCGRALSDSRVNKCPGCGRSLDFTHKNYLAKISDKDQDPEEMIGTSQSMREVFHLIRKLAPSDVPVLITGASGTGKEMVARAIHERSHRGSGPFVPINCGAIPRELLESELFGHEKGAFTGAYRTTVGTVERANGGTLFLDEVGELPPELQVKLLRFLQELAFTRVGGRIPIKVDLRVISATNADLAGMTQAGRFREDLYYRLDVVNIQLPPLKDRGDDALIMANVFLKRYANKVGKEIRGFSQRATTAVLAHPWPGNVRELVNRIRRGVVMADGPWLTPEHLGLSLHEIKPAPVINGGLKEAKAEFEAKLITETLTHYQGNAYLASKSLKISRSMLYHLIHKYDLKNYLSTGDKSLNAKTEGTKQQKTRKGASRARTSH